MEKKQPYTIRLTKATIVLLKKFSEVYDVQISDIVEDSIVLYFEKNQQNENALPQTTK